MGLAGIKHVTPWLSTAGPALYAGGLKTLDLLAKLMRRLQRPRPEVLRLASRARELGTVT